MTDVHSRLWHRGYQDGLDAMDQESIDADYLDGYSAGKLAGSHRCPGFGDLSWADANELAPREEISKWMGKYFGVGSEREPALMREVERLRKEVVTWRTECLEQARLNGMGGEREAALMGEVERLRKEVAELAHDNNALAEANERAGKLLTADLRLLSSGPSELGFTIESAGRMVNVIAGEMATWLRENKAENYTESAADFISSRIGSGQEQFIVTVQRKAGITPHEARVKAERERDEVRIEVGRIRAENASLHERLEDNHVWEEIGGEWIRVDVEPGSIIDGIACRDETIRLQEEYIKKLDAEFARVTKELRDAALDEIAKPDQEALQYYGPTY